MPSRDELTAVERSLHDAHYDATLTEHEVVTTDPWGTRLHVVHEPEKPHVPGESEQWHVRRRWS